MWRDLYGFVYDNLRTQGISHADAEDLAQDVILSAYVHLEDVEPERQYAWLRTVTRNKLIDRARRAGRVRSVAEVPESADPALGPDEVAIRSANRQMLLDAIACLPERDRRLVEVRYLEERTILETAQELELSASATKVALHRARERLRVILQAAETGGMAMSDIAERAVRALSPYVGPTVADMCIRGTAVSIGKTFDTLTAEDSAALEARARRVLAPLLPPDTIERVVVDIRGGAL